ncbi:MAG: hypothetical protein KAU20_05010 [Nanoarchaeota archaeon]|nr:hypothetical protein [Nanoarchaeota archaeon]
MVIKIEIDEEKFNIVGNDEETEKVFLITQEKRGGPLNRTLGYSKKKGFVYGLLKKEGVLYCPIGFKLHNKERMLGNTPYGAVEKKIIEEIDWYAKSHDMSVQDIAFTEEYSRLYHRYRNEDSPVIDKNNKDISIIEMTISDYKTTYHVYLRDNILEKN